MNMCLQLKANLEHFFFFNQVSRTFIFFFMPDCLLGLIVSFVRVKANYLLLLPTLQTFRVGSEFKIFPIAEFQQLIPGMRG